MKYIVSSVTKVIIAAVVSMILLSMFTYVYKFTPVRVVETNDATDYKWKPHSSLNTMEEGLAFLKTDVNGYNNSHPQSTPIAPDILLMGSSHMLAVEVKTDENVGYLLNDMTPYSIYNIGMAGHFLNTSISNLKSAINIYQPQKWVIVETDTIKLTDDDIRKVLSGDYPVIESSSSSLINYVQSVFPASKKIMSQISAWRSSDFPKVKKAEETDLNDKLLNLYFDKIVDDLNGLDMIIVYNPKTEIGENAQFLENGDAMFRSAFSEACITHGITFVDMTIEFKNLYEKENILAHGFPNTAIGKGHLNQYGHQIIAERLAQVIMEDQQK